MTFAHIAPEARPAVSVDELRQAWSAVQDGQFRDRPRIGTVALIVRPDAQSPAPKTKSWTPDPGERVLPVIGCVGSAGATTLALAIALSAGTTARVVECCSVTTSGLAAASTAELGLHDSGWRLGRRERVLLERASHVLVTVDEVPLPTASLAGGLGGQHETLTVLDAGWELGQLLAVPSWLGQSVRAAPVLVVVAPATVPGLRRLEISLDMLGTDRVIVALVGPRTTRWPKGVAHSAGPHTRRLLVQGQAVAVPEDRSLTAAGLDSTPLPAPILHAGARVLAHPLQLTDDQARTRRDLSERNHS